MTLKLTPQKAAELLKELQYAKVQMGGQLSIRDEYFKQALERVVKGVPDGWKLVPVEPTDFMCNTSHIGVDPYTGAAEDDEYYSIGGQCAAKVYRAMLAAAPEAPL